MTPALPCVLRGKARGQRDLVTVLGHSATIAAGEAVAASGTWVNDRGIAERLRALAAVPLPRPPIDVEKALPWVEQKIGLTLAQSRREAVARALASKLLVITGGSIVGKQRPSDCLQSYRLAPQPQSARCSGGNCSR